MSRPLDTGLEKRLLEAARKLWRSGEKNLTMRALAQTANTHAPGIYSRFRNRQDIIRMLSVRFELEMADAIGTAVSPEAATELYVEFAINHPREYQSWFTHRGDMPKESTTSSADDLGPAFRWLRQKLSQDAELNPENTNLALTIWALWRGTAALLVNCTASTLLADSARRAATSGVKALLQQARSQYTQQPQNAQNLLGTWHNADF